MENCIVTTLKREFDNNNLPYFGKVLLKLTNSKDSSVSLHFNRSSYSLLKWKNGETGALTILEGDAVFSNGAKVSTIEDAPGITIPANDVSLVLCDNAYNIVSLDVKNYNSITSDLSIIKDTPITSLLIEGGCFNIELLSQSITSIYANTSNYLYGSIKNVRLPNIGTGSGDQTTLMLTNNISPFTLTDIVNMLNNGNNESSVAEWGGLFRYATDSFMGGDVAIIPKNVYYVNFCPTIPMTCSLGQRNTSDCYILTVGGNDESYMATPTDIDNYLINNAGCSLKSGGGTIIHLRCKETYTPSSAATTAIETLKSKGITSIKVNNVSL